MFVQNGTSVVMRCILDDLPLSYLTHLLGVCHASLDLRDSKGYTAVHMAVRDEHAEALGVMLKHTVAASATWPSALDSEFGWTPLMHAAARNQKDMVKAMGEAGIDVNVQDKVSNARDIGGRTSAFLGALFIPLPFYLCLVFHSVVPLPCCWPLDSGTWPA
jgi:ankyrin repeat protein